MKDFFLDDFSYVNAEDGKDAIIRLLASDVLGPEQYEKLALRYYDMSRNFDCVTEDAKNKPHSHYENCVAWNFSTSIMPHGRYGRYYSDTTAVPIAITHPNFKDMRSKFIKDYHLDGAVVGLDLPTWFNLSSSRRVMIIAQDPLRNPKWYHECNAAICSSPFGLHSREHRDNGRGGLRMMLLIKALIKQCYGVYLTDSYKYYLNGWKQDKSCESFEVGESVHIPISKAPKELEAYHEILKKEIAIIQPTIIVAMGKVAQKALKSIMPEKDLQILSLPHFSGAAQGYYLNSDIYQNIKTRLRLKNDSTESQAAIFAHAIINNIEW